MALALQTKLQIESDTSVHYTSDITGEYDVTDNPTGYGDINADRNTFAGIFYGVTVDSEGVETEIAYDTSQVDYSAGHSNTYISSFTGIYAIDGWHKLHYFTVTTTPTVVEGEFYYKTGTSELIQIQSSLEVVITDYSLLVDAADVEQVVISQLMISKLAIAHNVLLEAYLDCACNCESGCDCESKKLEYQKLKYLLAGADYRFASGNTSSAQEMIEKLIKIYL